MDNKDKILVGCPIFEGHRKWVKPFIEQHSNHDIIFTENTIPEADQRLYDYLLKLQDKHPNIIEVVKHEWDPRNKWYIYMLGDCVQRMCDYAVKNNYGHYYWTSSDIFFCEGSSLENLKAHDLDIVGYPVNMYAYNGPASVYKDGWTIYNEKTDRFRLNYYSWDEIEDIKGVQEVYGCIGATLIKTQVLADKRVRFQHPETDTTWGEDLLLLQFLNQAGYKYHCDFNGRCMNYTEPDPYVKRLRDIYLTTNIHHKRKVTY